MLLMIILLFLNINTCIGYPKPRNNSTSVCMSEGCKRAAKTIKESLNEKVNPCDNFYEFACGHWRQNYTLKPTESQLNSFVELTEKMIKDLRKLLENDKVETYQPNVKIKNYYKSCMDENAINKLKTQPLLEHLRKTIGGWPVLEKNWDEKSFNWIEAIANLRLHGSNFLILSNVGPDAKNNSKHVLILDQTTLGLQLFMLYDRTHQYRSQRKAYADFMIVFAELLHGQKLSGIQKNEIIDVFYFEKDLVHIMYPYSRQDYLQMYNPMTIKELKNRYGDIDFDTYFKILFADTPLKPDDTALVLEVQYFYRLGKLIQKTSKRTLANYIGWRASQDHISLLSEEFQHLEAKFMEALQGTPPSTDRWRICAQATNSAFEFAVGKLYTDAHFSQESKKSIESLVADLKKEFREILTKADWMDVETKTYALRKLSAMVVQVGYPEIYTNPAVLEEELRDINVNSDTYFQNKINYLKSASQKELKKLQKPADRNEWTSGPADINAKNDGLRNSIVFPAAILQPPFFDADRLRTLNYGAIGMIIGHEITHGYDTLGKQFGIEGNLEQWWSKSAESRYQSQASCLVKQYNNIYVPEVKLHINGLNTLAENIADNGGLKEAYKAYKTAQQDQGIEPLLPGLNFSHEQLFFLSFANNWCVINQDARLRLDVAGNPHTPEKYRVLGTLANSQEFKEAFNCPNNSPMMNQEPCDVW